MSLKKKKEKKKEKKKKFLFFLTISVNLFLEFSVLNNKKQFQKIT